MTGKKIVAVCAVILMLIFYSSNSFYDMLINDFDGMSGNNDIGQGMNNETIVEIALNEVKEENNGGEKFWRYMGFEERVSWCACFVSWCVAQCGYYDLENDIFPRSALAEDYRKFFKEVGRWEDSQGHGGNYKPKKGDIIVFQWDGVSTAQIEHVGIVTDSNETMVFTVEGNSSDMVRERSYALDSKKVIGYGIPDYPDSNGSGGGIGEIGTGGYNTDPTNYTQTELELIWAIVMTEDSLTYEGALAVISTAMNRVDDERWCNIGENAYTQLIAPAQFCYSINLDWVKYLGGNVNENVKLAVNDCLVNGIRNHEYTSFRSKQGSHSGGQYIPDFKGNYYFN